MKLGRVTLSALLLLFPAIGFSQSKSDESRILEAALEQTFIHSFPYVQKWVVSQQSDPLPLGNAPDANVERARTDYIARNAESMNLSGLRLPERAATADISVFTQPNGFTWSAFEERFGADTWTARASRPGFADPSNAVVRIDVWARAKEMTATTVVFVSKQRDGAWRSTGGIVPAVNKSYPATATN